MKNKIKNPIHILQNLYQKMLTFVRNKINLIFFKSTIAVVQKLQNSIRVYIHENTVLQHICAPAGLFASKARKALK